MIDECNYFHQFVSEPKGGRRRKKEKKKKKQLNERNNPMHKDHVKIHILV